MASVYNTFSWHGRSGTLVKGEHTVPSLTHAHTHTHCSPFRSIFTCNTWSAHGLENCIYWKWDKRRADNHGLLDWGGNLTFYVNDVPSGAVCCKRCQSIFLAASLTGCCWITVRWPHLSAWPSPASTPAHQTGECKQTHTFARTEVLHTCTHKCALCVKAGPLCWEWWVVCYWE